MTTSLRPIWFRVLDGYSGDISPSFVELGNDALIVDFRTAVYDMNSTIFGAIAPFQILVYKNMASYENRESGEGAEGPLDPTTPIGLLGSTEDMLIVTVRRFSSSCRAQTALTKAQVRPDPKRRKRWAQLNEVLNAQAMKSGASYSRDDSHVTCYQVDHIFNLNSYVQSERQIDETTLDDLARHLSYTTKVFGGVATGPDAKRLHLIAPIFICVCSLYCEIELLVDEDLTGTSIKSDAHFDFMVRRGSKAVCVVLAKKEDFEQGIVHNLIGCEIAAEVYGLDTVYGIVTNYIQWSFFRNRSDGVEFQDCSLRLTPDGPHRDSLREIAEKICAMLGELN